MLAAVYPENLTGNTLHSFNTSNSLNYVLLGEICCSQNEGHVNGFCLLVHGDMLCMCTQEYRPSTSRLLDTLSQALYIILFTLLI